MVELAPPVERAFLIAVDTGQDEGWTAEESLAELANLADTAGAEVVGAEWQNRRHVDPNWYVGKGKAEELVQAKAETGFTLLVADDELRPNQQKALESLLGVKVLDRSGLILDIFAQHARTHEGRLQVELAQLEYQLPRLTRLWTHLSRTQGGIGSRGPGETPARDRPPHHPRQDQEAQGARRARPPPARHRRALARSPAGADGGDRRLHQRRQVLDAQRARPARRRRVAEDRLFATLDPTSRMVKLGDGQSRVVTDTVGFIHKLPHQLVDAFRATLEEVNRADVLLEVVDVADRHAPEHRQTVQQVLDELGAGEKPRLLVYNKADLVDPGGGRRRRAGADHRGSVLVSAHTGYGMDALRVRLAQLLAELWEEVDVAVPYSEGELLSRVRERGTVESATARATCASAAASRRRWRESCARRRGEATAATDGSGHDRRKLRAWRRGLAVQRERGRRPRIGGLRGRRL